MRYSEMTAFEKERTARRSRGDGAAPPDLGVGRLIWWPALLLVILALIAAGCASPTTYRDTTVQMRSHGPVDLERYQGLWYEVARFPNSFEEGCVGVTAEYTLNADGTVGVLNTCREGTLDGPVETAEGVATSVSPDNDRLRVTFVPLLPFASGDYWILGLDPDYRVAVVGAPSGTVGWVLSRTPELPFGDLQAAYAVLERNGYDLSRIIEVPQQP